MNFIFSVRESEGSYNNYKKKILVKFGEGMCSFLGREGSLERGMFLPRGCGVGRNVFLPLF